MRRKTLNRHASLLKSTKRLRDRKHDPIRARNLCLGLIAVGFLMFIGEPTSIITFCLMALFMGIFLRLLWVLQRWHTNAIRNFEWRHKHVL